MKRLTLNETWKLCLAMWKWIAEQKKKGNRKNVNALKREWLKDNWAGRGGVLNDCFFCEYTTTHIKCVESRGTGCSDCPGVFVDRQFDCDSEKYAYDDKPIPFYNKLVSLNRKRKRK